MKIKPKKRIFYFFTYYNIQQAEKKTLPLFITRKKRI
jgi:hypothetical protein